MLAPVECASLSFGIQRGEDAGITNNAGMERQKSEDRGRSEKDEHRGKRRLRHRTSNVQVSEDSDIEWEGGQRAGWKGNSVQQGSVQAGSPIYYDRRRSRRRIFFITLDGIPLLGYSCRKGL